MGLLKYLIVTILVINSSFSMSSEYKSSKSNGVAIIIVDAFLVSDDKMPYDKNDSSRNWAPENLSREIELMSEILQKANENKIPVFEFYNDGGYSTNQKILDMYDDMNWVSMSKNSYSIFTDNKVHQILEDYKVTKLIIMGFNQKLCVKESIIDALSLGYDVYTSFDIIQGHRIESDDLVYKFYQQNTFLTSAESLIDEFFN